MRLQFGVELQVCKQSHNWALKVLQLLLAYLALYISNPLRHTFLLYADWNGFLTQLQTQVNMVYQPCMHNFIVSQIAAFKVA